MYKHFYYSYHLFKSEEKIFFLPGLLFKYVFFFQFELDEWIKGGKQWKWFTQ